MYMCCWVDFCFDSYFYLQAGNSRLALSIVSSRVRFHYGHPDVFDRLFHITRGGMSKASRVINLSEDIFAGLQIP